MRTSFLLVVLVAMSALPACATAVSNDEPPSTTGGSGGQGGTTDPDSSTGGSGGAKQDASKDSTAEPAPDAVAESATDVAQDPAAEALTEAGIDSGTDAVADAVDAGVDAPVDTGVDSPIDVGVDAPVDTGVDAPIDVGVDAAVDTGVDSPIDTGMDVGTDAQDAEAGTVADETCPGEPIVLTGTGSNPRVGSVSSTTNTKNNDYTGNGVCGTASGKDAVYSFTPDVDGIALVDLTTTNFDAEIYVRTTCTTASSQIGCADSQGSSGTERVKFWATAGTTYWVFVDSYTSTSKGAFQLDVSVTPASAHEKCPGEAVTWTGSGTQDRTATLVGNTSALWNDATGNSCGSTSTPEAVYAFTADVDGILKLKVTPQGWDVAMYVRSNCSTASSQLACKDTGGSGGAENAQFWAAQGSVWYVFVDGALSGAAGAYTLEATLSPQKPDETCPGEPVVWTGSGTDPRTFTDTDDTSLHWSDTNGSGCGGTSARDTVYAVTADVDGIMTLSVAPTGWDAAMYIRTACTTSSSEIACKDVVGSGQVESHTFWATAGATYYAFVDGYTASSQGPYTFNATLVPAAADEKCPGENLTFSGSPPAANATGNTNDNWNDYTGSCTTGASEDVVYHVIAPQAGTMKVTATPATGFDVAVYVRQGTCTGTQVGCKDALGSGSAEVLNVTATAGTDYYIFVDGYQGASGAYTLNVQF
ncbi:MAG: hypothetical protein HY898_23500 [Deltaproteobacteria bacterium]|nr:hypothetical protein [Deltaproteobacteria bacterium]